MSEVRPVLTVRVGPDTETTSSNVSHRDNCRCLDSPEEGQRSGYKDPAAPSSESLLFHFLDSSLLQSVSLALRPFHNLCSHSSKQKIWF
jgi:hypothetical protein